jgi:peptidoglycan/LPS O-acetylase OafA/YrhL
MWSISVEEQFYIAIPLIALYGRRFGLKIVAFALIAVSHVMVMWYAWKGWHGFSSQWTNSFVQFQFFSAGILLSLALKGRTPPWSPVFRLIGVLTGIICLFVASVQLGVQADTPSSTIGQARSLEPYCFFSLYLELQPAICPSRSSISAAFPMDSISFMNSFIHSSSTCGRSSLSTSVNFYISRNGAEGVGTVIAFCLTILLAHLSYQFYERLFLRLKRRFTFIPSRD